MNTVTAGLKATIIYEFRMAVRRRVLWFALLPLLAIAVLVVLTTGRTGSSGPASGAVATFAVIMNIFTVVGLGVVLADRYSRTRRMGLADLLASTPADTTTRMAGVLVGSLAAGLTPVLVTMLVVAPIALARSSAAALTAPLWVLAAFLTMIVPAALLTTVLAATLALVMPVPVARVLVVLAWFWTTIFNSRIIPVPTPTGTVLSPLGDYVAAGWLRGEVVWAGRGAPGMLSPAVSAGTAALNLTLVLLVTAAVFALARTIAARLA